MKVGKLKKEFEPVVITLENEDEIDWLWHCIDAYTKNLMDYFLNRNLISFGDPDIKRGIELKNKLRE